MENRFNLIDEPWIPIADIGLVSLKQLFSDGSYRALGGTPVEKIALTKFLLAIAQSACTPENDAKWQQLGANGWQQHAWHTLKNGMTIFICLEKCHFCRCLWWRLQKSNRLAP
ncbi:CRISPR-associated protein Cse1 family [Vibrio ponticus]|nr:CRISPR-associated protein Cse1 family [Vibrio ponticus]